MVKPPPFFKKKLYCTLLLSFVWLRIISLDVTVPWNNWVYYFLIQAHLKFQNVGRVQVGFHARIWHNWTLAQVSETSLPSGIPRAVFMSEFPLARLIHLRLEHSIAQLHSLRRSFHQSVPEAWEPHVGFITVLTCFLVRVFCTGYFSQPCG